MASERSRPGSSPDREPPSRPEAAPLPFDELPTGPDPHEQPTPGQAPVAPAAAEVRPGLALEHFQIVRFLGRGGMGVVYEAEDTLLRRRVAIKVLPPAAPADDGHLRRMLREARAVARLSHPAVVAIYHIGRWEHGYFLVLEYLRGGSLQDRLKARGPLPWREATRAVADACRGLGAVDAAGLIHRDIKPSNLLCDEAGAVKVTDFGLVPAATFSDASSLSLVGTPEFMSPEQARGEPVDERSDLYALGATYFALLTGQPPYPGGGPMLAMFAHCTAPVPDPREQRPDVPEACAGIIRKAMAKQPADRYQGAAEMLAALSQAATAEPHRGAP